MQTKHIMIDIETLGLSNNAVIAQIAALEFSPENSYIPNTNPFQCNIDIDQNGRAIEVNTLKWWLEQSVTTRNAVFSTASQFPLVVALNSLALWISTIGEKTNLKFWCRGVNFDFILLNDAYAQYNLDTPWKYTSLADVRTFDSLVPPEILQSIPRVGEHHNALDDCKFQISYVQAAIKWLNTNATK